MGGTSSAHTPLLLRSQPTGKEFEMTVDLRPTPKGQALAVVRVQPSRSQPNVACVLIDNPPVNAGSHAVRVGLISAIAEISADSRYVAGVLIGAGTTFISGSDLKEFGQPLIDPQMPMVIAAIEDCPKPIVAAIHGAGLGGGYEIALGCDARIASRDAVVGLPEVTLGMIPGAGGTVRLPRLIDPAAALALIVAGRRVSAEEALSLGMVDAIAKRDLVDEAADLAASLASSGGKRRLRDRAPKAADQAAYQQVVDATAANGKARPQALEAIAAVRRALDLPFEPALAAERRVFQELRQGEEAAALRHIFFAERLAGRVRSAGLLPSPRKVAILGAGLMGAGIASSFLAAGLEVHLIDLSDAAVEKGRERIRAIEDQAVAAGRMDADERMRRRDRLSISADWSDIAHADMVVEAAVEDMAVKAEIFSRLGPATRKGCILATNTSYLDIDTLAAASGRAEDVVGLHFFSPAHIMRLVEVVRGDRTSLEVLAAAVKMARRLGKLPIISGVGEGFIANRIFMAYREQCEYMLEEGALPEEVDRALTSFGFAMGPFATWDMAGLDIAWRTRQRLAASGVGDKRFVPLLGQLCEAGRLGRKSGAGWYAYGEDAKKGSPDPIVQSLTAAHRDAQGIAARRLEEREIVNRALAAIVNEAALVVSEGIAERAGDIDLVFVNGYGFPKHRGGPLFWASRRSSELEEALEHVATATGASFRRGPVQQLLSSLAT
jgi:3-hydroxyacyl-CoA dehydrogenase